MSNNQKRSARIYKEMGEVKIETDISMNATKLSDKTLAETNQLLSIWGMTVLQYNALRVLYVKDSNKAGDNEGLPSKEIGKRLYTRVPDVTRLLDRLVDKGWITKERDTINRRVVRSRLTTIGIELVESIHKPMQELESQQLLSLDNEEKATLALLLRKALSK